MLNESTLQKGELKAIAKILTKMQEVKYDYESDSLGIPSIQTLATHLRRGRVKESIEYARSLSDDLWAYPEIRRFIHDVIYPIGYLDLETGLYTQGEEK